MIKIEVRQNRKFEMGYPYNSSVDSYFKSLSTDFINNYGLDSETVLEINNHKNKTLQFDLDLHEFVVKLSAFMVGFETTGQVMIDEFDELVSQRNSLMAQLEDMENNKSDAVKEYEFVLANIEQLKEDILKIDDFISYYQGQIVDDTYIYNDGYIDDTTLALSVLDDITTQNESDFEYYKTTLGNHVLNLVNTKTKLFSYSFQATSLRSMYEEWQKRSETYYKNLVAYFKDAYDTDWTYGTSLMYGEVLEEDAASMNVYRNIAARWQETLFKRYNFAIDAEVKEYSLVWLEQHPTFEEAEFNYSIESKKVEILKRELSAVEGIVIDKRQAVRSVIPHEDEQNYFKYRELVLEKRKYIYSQINGTIDQAVIDNYDDRILELQSSYDKVIAKYTQATYWNYLADWEMHSELYTDLKRQLDKSLMAISREFKKDVTDNSDYISKINFYVSEKAALEDKIEELSTMRQKLEIENNVYNDEITLVSSKLYEATNLIEQKRNEYIVYFDDRISFFTQNVTVSENEGIVELLDGNFFRDFDDSYQEFVDYSSNIEWYSLEDRESLKSLYSTMLDIIKDNLQLEWKREFGHSILDTKKYDIYAGYFDTQTRTLYALINKHLLEGVYSDTIMDSLNAQLEKVKDVFTTYADIAFNIQKNVTVISSMFDYNKTFEFTIEDGNETKENVIETFNTIVDDIVAFAYNKNIEFRVFENYVDTQEKIDQVWLDMEKKYV